MSIRLNSCSYRPEPRDGFDSQDEADYFGENEMAELYFQGVSKEDEEDAG